MLKLQFKCECDVFFLILHLRVPDSSKLVLLHSYVSAHKQVEKSWNFLF